MNTYRACEQAYKNGFEDGKKSAGVHNIEIALRVKLAYEQLAESHSAICRSRPSPDDLIFIRDDLHSIMNRLLEIQVKLGVLKREEDIK